MLLIASTYPDFFTERDLHFLETVALWVGVVLHRAELSELHTREQTERTRQLAAKEMMTIMAHDLRNYLTLLKGRLDLLQRRASREGHEPSSTSFLLLLSAKPKLGCFPYEWKAAQKTEKRLNDSLRPDHSFQVIFLMTGLPS